MTLAPINILKHTLELPRVSHTLRTPELWRIWLLLLSIWILIFLKLVLGYVPQPKLFISNQWRIQDFPKGGANPCGVGASWSIFPENCIKNEEILAQVGGALSCPLDPPMVKYDFQLYYILSVHLHQYLFFHIKCNKETIIQGHILSLMLLSPPPPPQGTLILQIHSSSIAIKLMIVTVSIYSGLLYSTSFCSMITYYTSDQRTSSPVLSTKLLVNWKTILFYYHAHNSCHGMVAPWKILWCKLSLTSRHLLVYFHYRPHPKDDGRYCFQFVHHLWGVPHQD